MMLMLNAIGETCGAFRRLVSRFRRETAGVAAIEFAFIMPVMLALYFLTMEFSQAIDANKKVGRVASQVADLVTQSNSVTRNDLDAIMKIGESILQPYSRSNIEIEVIQIEITDEKTPKALVDWSRRMKDGNFGKGPNKGTRVEIPEALMVPGNFLIRAQSSLDYAPVITWSASGKKATGLVAAFDSINMSERYYLRPRMSTEVPCGDC
ncbi:TadE/TadG family type IV pilus assembly protein [Nitratireductor basaltis]|uniref:TadE-like domain-containing protein n=1 Tax=Nitratireductor basaltis TaxID=472175 RepID=A0A084UEE4_9HYPH|nr:TadE/TadG family type IV pilus assembly protein [Nitratireductor basaltis]KFB11330.1 hypothetical protein EL18_02378 [Nitratireductor basaltis]